MNGWGLVGLLAAVALALWLILSGVGKRGE
jgi:hypothetical protein